MLNTLFVLDDDASLSDFPLNAISFDAYLREYPKKDEPRMRIINLCDTGRYLSQGYYCSLLAEARQHQVLPSIKVINTLRSEGASLWLSHENFPDLESLVCEDLLICMGESYDKHYKKVAATVFQEFSAPLLRVSLIPEINGLRAQVTRANLSELSAEERIFCIEVLQHYSRKPWKSKGVSKQYRWEMAMLVNPEEKVPPSNKMALSRFIKAGEKLGIKVSLVAANDLRYLSHYDALFIRETTAINHHTYRLAREAEQLGLVVMDDPDSILRCCNKVFLHDAFNYKGVPSLQTIFMKDTDKDTLDSIEASLGMPMILKMPEGSFSKGVFKVESREELESVSARLLEDSALVLAQEYLFTDFDWRIGVLNERVIYACRYYMARNHWQIYNHDSTRFFSGGFDAMPSFEVPAYVLNAALKSASVVGNGLYGIDIKTLDDKAYVLEVNDNPSIDHGVEDDFLGEELYMQIMSEFLRRLEDRGRNHG